MAFQNEFVKTINWDLKHKFLKVFKKTNKKGETFFLGEMTKTVEIMITPATGQFAKEGEYQIWLIPITYKRADQASIQAPVVRVEEAPVQPKEDIDELPF